jgi:hypothetical protein
MTPPILAILGSLMVCVAVSAFAHFKIDGWVLF